MTLHHRLFATCVSMLLPVTAMAVAMSPAHAAASTDDRLRAVLVNDAECLVEYERPMVNAFLATTPGKPAAERQARMLDRTACVTGDHIAFQPDHLRGALFVALYRAQFGASGSSLADPAQEATAWPRSTDAQTAAMQGFAACVVRADSADARNAVMAVPGSHEEDAAIAALRPQLGSCFPKGGTATFNRMALTGLLAEALYRLAPSAPDTGS